MTHNPTSCQVYSRAEAIACDTDLNGSVQGEAGDPVEAARREAAEAALELNDGSQARTPAAIAKVEELSRRALSMATEANLELMHRD